MTSPTLSGERAVIRDQLSRYHRSADDVPDGLRIPPGPGAGLVTHAFESQGLNLGLSSPQCEQVHTRSEASIIQ